MSFSDFKGSGSSRSGSGSNTNAVKRPTTSASAALGSNSNSHSNINSNSNAGRDDSGVGVISESLLQYQRNVGILEKIVQSLTTPRPSAANTNAARRNNNHNHNNSNNNVAELEMQYKAQVDVIGQLEEKLLRQLQQQKRAAVDKVKTTLIKLSRDFERVQARAVQLQGSVSRWHKQQAASAAAVAQDVDSSSGGGMAGAGAASAAQQDYYEQMQLQLEEDRLNEEIMREREEEIRNINRGMHQVNEIYKDLAHIVGSQQEHVDSIETQMEESKINAESGLQQVEKANEKFGASQCTIS